MIELMRALHALSSSEGAPPLDWELVAGRNANALLADDKDANWYRAHVIEAISTRGGASDEGLARHKRSGLAAWRNETALRTRVRQSGRSGSTIVHRTYHPVIDRLPRATPVVETLHDLWDFIAPDERGARAALRRYLKRHALERADRIVCVSHSTRDFLGNIWPRLADRSVVIPHGTSRLADAPANIERARPFFLFVGRRDRYKNFSILLDALTGVREDSELVCLGGGPFTPAEQQAIADQSLSRRVHQVDGDDRILAGHYRAALALLYPSRHEGFGLPLLEAMSHDCPVIAAPLTSLPEVGGQAALYADADDTDAWSDAMSSLLEDGALRARAIEAGRERVAGFSWQETARRHIELYRDMGA